MRHLLFSSKESLNSHIAIPQLSHPIPQNDIAQKVAFVTGATGFIGGYLLKELLINNTFETIICLVRPSDAQSGFDRIKENLIKKGTDESLIDPNKIIAINGDVLLPQFGLKDDQYLEICQQVDHVFHFAATMNWVTPFNQNTIANIEALKTAIHICANQKLKKLHYASSMGLWTLLNHGSDTLLETSIHDQANELPGGYFQSKWVCEKTLHLARAAGIPVNIYRIGDVKGNSNDGLGDPQNFGNLVMQYFMLRGVAIDCDTPEFNFIPVDYLTKAIAHIATNQTGKTFQFSNPELISFKDIYRAANAIDQPLKLISKTEWIQLLKNDTSEFGKLLKPIFRSFTPDPSIAPTSFYQIGVDMFQKRHDTTNTFAALLNTDIACPAMIKDQVLQRYLSHLSKNVSV
jgi:thioester reductase-like protein